MRSTLPSTFLIALHLLGSVAASKKDLPHVVFLLIDDFGWADASWHRPDSFKEVQTPNMHELLRAGIELDQAYAYKYCSPSRSAIQSGRNPIHVNAQNVDMASFDPENPLTGLSGIPVNMTGLAERLAAVGYTRRVYSGKADFGMAYKRQTPIGRGYNHALFYFQHMNDYWSLNVGNCGTKEAPIWTRDLYGTLEGGGEGPRYDLLNPPHCWVQNMSGAEDPVAPYPKQMGGCMYVDDLFTNFSVSQIMQHEPDRHGPLLLFHAAHSIHTPLEIVPEAYEAFSFIDYHDRRAYASMVYHVDQAVGRIVGALRSRRLFDTSLIIMSADNGGPVYMQGRGAGNNYPLRGGKAGNWQGGIRVNSFVSGGFVPKRRRGSKLTGLVTCWDWYSTLIRGIAGLDPTDTEAAAAGLPPIDSVDQWAYLSGATDAPPRTALPIGTQHDPDNLWATHPNTRIVVRGMIQAEAGVAADGISGAADVRVDDGGAKLWKLLLGRVPMSIWTGPRFPNATTATLPPAEEVFYDCGMEKGCLFELLQDPGEHTDLADAHPDVVARLRRAIEAANATVFSPHRPQSKLACEASLTKYKDPTHKEFGWWGPFADEL
jgi:arylsulfatase B